MCAVWLTSNLEHNWSRTALSCKVYLCALLFEFWFWLLLALRRAWCAFARGILHV